MKRLTKLLLSIFLVFNFSLTPINAEVIDTTETQESTELEVITDNSNMVFDNDILFMKDINSDLKINSLKSKIEGNKIYFELDYVSDSDRRMSFFNPPEGDIFMYTVEDAIKEGSHILYFSVPLFDFSEVNEVTLGFFDDENSDFIFYKPNSKDKVLAVKSEDYISDVQFNAGIDFGKQIDSDDLKVISLKTAVKGNDMVYALEYESKYVRNLSYFSPPNGDKFMYRLTDGIKEGLNTLYFTVPIEIVNLSKEITIGFFDDEGNSDFIFYDRTSTNKALKILDTKSTIKLDKNLKITKTIKNTGLQVISLKSGINGDNMFYELKYKSDKNLGLSFFSPPNGKIFMYISKDCIKVGENKLYFSVPLDQVNKAKEITIKFLGDSKYPNDFVYFKNTITSTKK